MGFKGVTTMGLFGDIFKDDDFEISSEEQDIDEFIDDEEECDDWGTGIGATWDTGQKPDIWNTDEPWTCHEDCLTDEPCSHGADCDCKPGFDVDDFFS